MVEQNWLDFIWKVLATVLTCDEQGGKCKGAERVGYRQRQAGAAARLHPTSGTPRRPCKRTHLLGSCVPGDKDCARRGESSTKQPTSGQAASSRGKLTEVWAALQVGRPCIWAATCIQGPRRIQHCPSRPSWGPPPSRSSSGRSQLTRLGIQSTARALAPGPPLQQRRSLPLPPPRWPPVFPCCKQPRGSMHPQLTSVQV